MGKSFEGAKALDSLQNSCVKDLQGSFQITFPHLEPVSSIHVCQNYCGKREVCFPAIIGSYLFLVTEILLISIIICRTNTVKNYSIL
jgi:hypothetical protein